MDTDPFLPDEDEPHAFSPAHKLLEDALEILCTVEPVTGWVIESVQLPAGEAYMVDVFYQDAEPLRGLFHHSGKLPGIADVFDGLWSLSRGDWGQHDRAN